MCGGRRIPTTFVPQSLVSTRSTVIRLHRPECVSRATRKASTTAGSTGSTAPEMIDSPWRRLPE